MWKLRFSVKLIALNLFWFHFLLWTKILFVKSRSWWIYLKIWDSNFAKKLYLITAVFPLIDLWQNFNFCTVFQKIFFLSQSYVRLYINRSLYRLSLKGVDVSTCQKHLINISSKETNRYARMHFFFFFFGMFLNRSAKAFQTVKNMVKNMSKRVSECQQIVELREKLYLTLGMRSAWVWIWFHVFNLCFFFQNHQLWQSFEIENPSWIQD